MKDKTVNNEAGMPAAQDLTEKKPEAAEVVYTVKELAAAHEKQFGCSYELVAAALLQAGKTSATLAEASELVDWFRKREVR